RALDEQPRLEARAGTVLDELRVAPEDPDDLVDMALHDRDLGARRVVLGQLADRLEQLRAAPVVEVLRGDRLARRRQAGEPGLAERGPLDEEVVVPDDARAA